MIAIIAVLAAICSPPQLRAGRCSVGALLSNMQQIGQAIELYVQDNQLLPDLVDQPPRVPSSRMPRTRRLGQQDSTNPAGHVTWDVSIASYLRGITLICADNPNSDGLLPDLRHRQYTQRP